MSKLQLAVSAIGVSVAAAILYLVARIVRANSGDHNTADVDMEIWFNAVLIITLGVIRQVQKVLFKNSEAEFIAVAPIAIRTYIFARFSHVLLWTAICLVLLGALLIYPVKGAIGASLTVLVIADLCVLFAVLATTIALIGLRFVGPARTDIVFDVLRTIVWLVMLCGVYARQLGESSPWKLLPFIARILGSLANVTDNGMLWACLTAAVICSVVLVACIPELAWRRSLIVEESRPRPKFSGVRLYSDGELSASFWKELMLMQRDRLIWGKSGHVWASAASLSAVLLLQIGRPALPMVSVLIMCVVTQRMVGKVMQPEDCPELLALSPSKPRLRDFGKALAASLIPLSVGMVLVLFSVSNGFFLSGVFALFFGSVASVTCAMLGLEAAEASARSMQGRQLMLRLVGTCISAPAVIGIYFYTTDNVLGAMSVLALALIMIGLAYALLYCLEPSIEQQPIRSAGSQ